MMQLPDDTICVMPWATFYPEAVRSLCEAVNPMLVYVGYSNYAYAELMASLWDGNVTTIIVEHDIVVHESAIRELALCRELWCAFPYREVPDPTSDAVTGLGCTKLDRKLLRSVGNPFLLPVNGGFNWRNVDYWVGSTLRKAGFEVHRHEPPVRNLSVEQ